MRLVRKTSIPHNCLTKTAFSPRNTRFSRNTHPHVNFRTESETDWGRPRAPNTGVPGGGGSLAEQCHEFLRKRVPGQQNHTANPPGSELGEGEARSSAQGAGGRGGGVPP